MSERKRKKGIRHEEEYQRNKIKKCRVSGESHGNWKGRYVPARNYTESMNFNCCHKNCLRNANPPEELNDILTSFYTMGLKNEQDNHLQRLMELKVVERRRGRDTTLFSKRKPKTKKC
ncbi:hypothetical protein EVAR_97935_1 [Eumeta japonica]|uniref:Uncharacterized protein n=1 Tax=Eumeta variegata TaxID=151549 RepID=A0A4C1XYG2_EUMVA|nr:hypothetical protein EVAR_97935_1 [Eumeta japonica]